jgi:hypothetical protein
VHARARDRQRICQDARWKDALGRNRCDNEKGAAFGICNAYCEAHDCGDPNQKSSDRSCEVLKEKFEKLTGRPIPCSLTCPCERVLKLFADITSGAVPVKECIVYPTQLFLFTDTGDYALVDSGASPSCSVNGQGPFVVLDETERLVCRVKLRQAVEARGVTCRSPE